MREDMKFTRQELDKTIWRIAIPCVLENLLTFAATLVIAAMIGRLTADEISAQSIGNRITGILTALFKGLGVGATIVMGLYFGRNEKKACRRIAEQMMLLVAGLALALSLAAFAFPAPLLGIFTNDAAFIAMAIPYVRIAIWLVPCIAVSRITTAAFNAQSNTRTPMVIAVAMNFINAGLGYVTIFGLNLGLKGAAVSLAVSNFLGMAMGLFALYRRGGLFDGVEREKQQRGEDLMAVIKTGLPASLENMMWSFAAIFMSRAMLTFDTTSYAGYQLASQVEEFIAAPCFGFQLAATTLVAQCVGRQENREAQTYHKRVLFWAALVTAPLALLLIFAPGLAMGLLTDKAGIAHIGAIYLIIAGIGFVPQALNMVDFGVLRAAGYKNLPLIATILGMWCIRVPVACAAAWLWHSTIVVVFVGIVADCSMRWLFGLGFIAIQRHRKKSIWSEKGDPL